MPARTSRCRRIVSARRTSALSASALGSAYDVSCRAARSPYGRPEAGRVAQLILPRRGVFVVQLRGERVVVDPTTAIVIAGGEEYSVSHPTDGGDDCTVLILPPELREEAVGTADGAVARLEARQHLAIRSVTQALRRAEEDLEGEDATALLVDVVAPAFAERSEVELRPGQRARVESVRALLAASPTGRWTLATIAEAAGCSPFHLAREFRRATGKSLSRYLLELRLALAVDRLANGETNLSLLALELGFSHHSHFSSRFRGVFGRTPSAVRETLTRARGNELLALVATAPA
jgi:AraC family transcriptional regulator